MYDKELVREILTQIYQATQTVLKRFEPIKSADVFPKHHSSLNASRYALCPLLSLSALSHAPWP